MQMNPMNQNQYLQNTGYSTQNQFGQSYPVYNPYQYQQRMQQYQQPVQQNYAPSGIPGKVIQTEEAVVANDVPMDGSTALFPMQDMSMILAKSWNGDGTIKTTVYKPILDNKGTNANNLPLEEEKSKIDALSETTEALVTKIDELFGKIEQLEQSMTKTTTKSRGSVTKKDGAE